MNIFFLYSLSNLLSSRLDTYYGKAEVKDAFGRNTPMQTTVDLTPHEVVPAVQGSTAHGYATLLRLDDKTIRYDVQVFGLKPTTIHFLIAPTGQNAATPIFQPVTIVGSRASGTLVVPAEAMDKLKIGQWYVLVHTAGGVPALRGQVIFGEHLQGALDVTAKTLRLIYDGLVYINIHTAGNPMGEVRAHVARPEPCSPVPSQTPNTCFHVTLSDEHTVPRFQETTFPRTSATAAVRMLDLGDLEFSMYIKNPKGVIAVDIRMGGYGMDGPVKYSVSVDDIRIAQANGNEVLAYEINAVFPRSCQGATNCKPEEEAAIIEAFRTGNMFFSVSRAQNGKRTQVLRGQIPALFVIPNEEALHIPGRGVPFAPGPNLNGEQRTVVVGQKLIFELPSGVNLQQMSR